MTSHRLQAVVQIIRKGAKPIVPTTGNVVDGKVSVSCAFLPGHFVLFHAMLTFVRVQVANVNPRLAVVDILCVGSQPLIAKYTGIIRFARGKSMLFPVYADTDNIFC